MVALNSLHKITASSGSGKRNYRVRDKRYSFLWCRIERRLPPCLEFLIIYRKTGFLYFKDINNKNNQILHIMIYIMNYSYLYFKSFSVKCRVKLKAKKKKNQKAQKKKPLPPSS